MLIRSFAKELILIYLCELGAITLNLDLLVHPILR